MKLFISADIEGCAGVSFTPETHKTDPSYAHYAEEMTTEVRLICEAAHAAGAEEITVKDGHGDASNIDPFAMPDYVTLIRGKSGHPYNMMYGLDSTYDGVFFLGYHAAAGDPEFAISHTSTGNSQYIRLNGQYMSECMLNAYTASSLGVPVLFLSGDESICREAKAFIPAITTVSTKRGVGGATFCVSRSEVHRRLREAAKLSLSSLASPSAASPSAASPSAASPSAASPSAASPASSPASRPSPLPLPEEFIYEVTYKDWKKAYQMAFYPGMEQIDRFTIRLKTKNWLEVVTAHSFVVY